MQWCIHAIGLSDLAGSIHLEKGNRGVEGGEGVRGKKEGYAVEAIRAKVREKGAENGEKGATATAPRCACTWASRHRSARTPSLLTELLTQARGAPRRGAAPHVPASQPGRELRA